MGEFITTYTGKHFEPTNPDPELIRIGDIAHALSMICRGNGHVKTFWSVGQHCICCAREAAARGLSNRMVLACLLHDASECYMGYKTAALALTDDSVGIDNPELMQEEKLAIILGTEGEGLMDRTIEMCDYTVKIPMSHDVDSLNVAAASAVAFWQLGKKQK